MTRRLTLPGSAKRSIWAYATCLDVLRIAGITPPTDLRKCMLCPLHAERDPSFKLVGPNGTGWVCFSGCGHGGVADLAIKLGLGRDMASAARVLEKALR